MDNQIWSWILTIVGLTGFWLAGKKIWWSWYVNIGNQSIWVLYSLVTKQWGFLIGCVFYTFVFAKNAISWTEEHNDNQNRI